MFELLEDAVAQGVFPGCVAMVWRNGALSYDEAHGTLGTHPCVPGYEKSVTRDTVYDLASLTKVLCTTTLAALAISQGELRLDDPVPAAWARGCPGATLGDLLEHCSGLPAHVEYFRHVRPFDAAALLEAVANTDPAYPLRSKAVYSDLGFIVLGAWLERVFDAELDRAFADRVAYPLGLERPPRMQLGFRRLSDDAFSRPSITGRIAPTEVYDRSLVEEVPSHLPIREHVPYARGEVHDDNAYVMGGVAGHAGLFGTAAAVLEVARAWTEPSLPGLREDVRDRFWRPSTVPGSTRRLGWDGPSPDGTGVTGRAFSLQAVGHTGYTGTSLYIDPHAEGGPLIAVLLSNRVHPTRTNEAIKPLRRRFHALATAL